MAGRWIVTSTHRGRELWAAENVARQGREFYLPRIEEIRKVRQRMRLICTKPLFPGYLFVFIPDDHWHFLQNTFGVSGVLMDGDSPAHLADATIAAIKEREEDGVVRLPTRNKAKHRFEPGALVRITDGMLSGYQGIYRGDSGKDRINVLLDFLGRKTSVLLAGDLLEAV